MSSIEKQHDWTNDPHDIGHTIDIQILTISIYLLVQPVLFSSEILKVSFLDIVKITTSFI